MFVLSDYENEKNVILNNSRYSEQGKREALDELNRRYKQLARKSIKELRKDAVIASLKLRDLQEKRFTLVEKAQASIDYSRLNYEAQKVRSQVISSDNLSDVEVAFRRAKQTGNDYALMAWKDISEGLINERFGGEGDYTDFRGELLNDIKSQEVNLAKVEIAKEEKELHDELAEIDLLTDEINELFGTGQSVINNVFEGISSDNGKIKLDFDYQTHILTDKRETPSEVAFRLEREREKALEQYQTVLKEKGLDGVLDTDFDDLRGVFDGN